MGISQEAERLMIETNARMQALRLAQQYFPTATPDSIIETASKYAEFVGKSAEPVTGMRLDSPTASQAGTVEEPINGRDYDLGWNAALDAVLEKGRQYSDDEAAHVGTVRAVIEGMHR